MAHAAVCKSRPGCHPDAADSAGTGALGAAFAPGQHTLQAAASLARRGRLRLRLRTSRVETLLARESGAARGLFISLPLSAVRCTLFPLLFVGDVVSVAERPPDTMPNMSSPRVWESYAPTLGGSS